MITFLEESFYDKNKYRVPPMAIRVYRYSGLTRSEYAHFTRENTQIVLPFDPKVSFNEIGYSLPVFLQQETNNLLHLSVGFSFDTLQQSATELSFFLWIHAYDSSIQFFTTCGVKIVYSS
jgi:hypothetical protein